MWSFILLCSVLCACIVLANGKKTATWPPRVLYHLFEVKPIEECLQRHNPDVKKLERFELTDDFDNLPNDRSMKCYMHCLATEYGFMKPNSTVVNPTTFVEAMNHMETSEQNIFLKMFRKCNKKNKDLCEMVYQMNICMKKNDNEHYYIFYSIPDIPE